MSVKKEPNGRRSVQVEVEVPGTPEQVWEAIATGPGISSWFVPTRMVEGPDGKPKELICNFGPGMDSAATITRWEPPRLLAAENAWGPGMPTVATEWIVEARGGGKCVVRVVHSLFASTDDWDNQLESTESGWPAFFRILQIYLTHFRGQPSSLVQVVGFGQESEAKAWADLAGPLGLENLKVGQRWRSGGADALAGKPPVAPDGTLGKPVVELGGALAGKPPVAAGAVPALSGTVEALGHGKHPHHVLLRLEEPTSGVASLGAYDCGAVQVMVSLYLYGERAAAAAEREGAAWRAWMNERFPMNMGAAAGA